MKTGWDGMKVIVTSTGHPQYDKVLTLVGKLERSNGKDVWRAQLESGHQTTLTEGEFKVVKSQT